MCHCEPCREILPCPNTGPPWLSRISAYSVNQSLKIDTLPRASWTETGQELFCLRELVVSFDPRSEILSQRQLKAIFLKSHLERRLSTPWGDRRWKHRNWGQQWVNAILQWRNLIHQKVLIAGHLCYGYVWYMFILSYLTC